MVDFPFIKSDFISFEEQKVIEAWGNDLRDNGILSIRQQKFVQYWEIPNVPYEFWAIATVASIAPFSSPMVAVRTATAPTKKPGVCIANGRPSSELDACVAFATNASSAKPSPISARMTLSV